ncbi:MAG: alpha/beta hydrolase fold domain-containing protein [Pseudomonadota bacterium]|nr:alpha/beta hydrolase fold domain-containing protein [Pseudomonadota bacterium]
MPDTQPTDRDQHDVIIVGTGFAGIGMAIRLQQAGFRHITLLEKATELGGTWRDNRYPGAACDVPSHLYSFSFEPNPRWSHVFAPQPEILDYLNHCADKYDVRRLIRFGTEMEQAHYDETRNHWQVQLKGGTTLTCRYLITATGQLSRPALPDIPGIDEFQGKRFHSAQWDPELSLTGKTVAVVGTGASAIQFVPEVAQQAQRVTVFQRSPNYIMERKDRPYSPLELRMMARFPWLTKLYRLQIYLNFESRSLAFSRFGWLMTPMVKWPFLRLLKKQVKNPTLREQLVPDYPVGCKRILLTNNYLEALERDNVELITTPISRITATGVETADGRTQEADVMIYGTGFAATEFLTPMQITGRQGVNLNDAWQRGAEAYLGITVPGFPNFFMLYGPNTNLGHNSIIYMLESQIVHVMRCLTFMRDHQVAHMEVDTTQFRRFNQRIQQLLRLTVWNGCKSWYVDANGHNSVNWPGSTLRYRYFTAHRHLEGYRFERPAAEYPAPLLLEPGRIEAVMASLLRGFLRLGFKPFMRPRFSLAFQRRWSDLLGRAVTGSRQALCYQFQEHGLQGEILAPKANGAHGVILFLHGGAYCVGSPATCRSLTSHLAAAAGMDVWVPDYRLAPEHPYPAALDDARAAYQLLQSKGYRPADIMLAGDSAGAGLALALALQLKQEGQPLPAGLLLVSPFVDNTLSGATLHSKARDEPMLREEWLQAGVQHYEGRFPGRSLLDEDLGGLPPMMVQVGEDEILLADATRLADKVRADGGAATLEIYHRRWHDFQLAASRLRSARKAIQVLARFARQRVDASQQAPLRHGDHFTVTDDEMIQHPHVHQVQG